MPLNSQFLKAQAEAKDYKTELIDQTEREIGALQAELDEWKNADPLIRSLQKMEASALEAMLSSSPEEMITARERVLVIRDLLIQRERLERTLDGKKSLLEEVLNED